MVERNVTQFIFYHSEDSLDLSGRRFLLMLLVSTSLNLSSVPDSKDGPIINGWILLLFLLQPKH